MAGSSSGPLMRIFNALAVTQSFSAGWPDGDWPVGRRFSPPRLEVVVGAILTQNVAWTNVEKALAGLIGAGLTTAQALSTSRQSLLEQAVRPAGCYRQKADRLKRVAGFIVKYDGDFYRKVDRDELLSLNGVGPETADSILLYACGRPEFVVDAYTRRVLGRYGLVNAAHPYDRIKERLEGILPADVPLFKKYHALIVEHAKRVCRKEPLCLECCLNADCRTARL